MSISKLLNQKNERIIFTTPSHNQEALFNKEFKDFYKFDYSELDGFDNLANPKNSILVAQGKVSENLGALQSYFIVQGATTGILASMKAVIKPGDRVLVARNCHKCVYSGLILSAGFVEWFMPEFDSEWGIYTTIDTNKLERTLQANEYKVFIMTSPTYEGINSDIEKIAKICHNYGVCLIVDEAHGALYNFSSMLPETAIKQGADISVNSLHKTAGALNQTALLNISKNLKDISPFVFQNALNLIQTSSPSYPLLYNIESCISYLMHAENEINSIISFIKEQEEKLEKYGVEFYNSPNHDPMKILLKKQGVSGNELSDTLFEDFDIEDEMNNEVSCLYLTGIGTTKQKLTKLFDALKKITPRTKRHFDIFTPQPYPIVKIQPVDSFNLKYNYVSKNKCLLKISNKMILPYPPGIGLLYPGEAIQKWHLDFLDDDVEVIEQ